jgi:signal transduction histidine kinase/ligand-binding sensor domain-containing protein
MACPAVAQEHFHADAYDILNWRTAHGLPSNVVRSIAVTSDGWLWTDHIGQLARFDGVRFDPISLRVDGTSANQVIHGGLLARSGELRFVDGRGGIHRWRAGEWEQVAAGVPLGAVAAAEGTDGATWVGGRGLVRVNGGSIARIAQHPVADIHIDPAGTPWFCGRDGVYRWEHGAVARVGEGDRDIHGHRLCAAAQGGLLVHQSSAIVFLQGAAQVRVALPRVGGVRWTVHDSLTDGDGFAWWATDAGLFRIPLSDLTPDRFDVAKLRPLLPKETTGSIRALCLDDAGNIWAGSETHGLFYLRRTAARLLPPPADRHTSSLVCTSAGELLLYTRPQLWRMNAEGRFVPDSTHKNAALAPAAAGGVWVAGAEGTYRYDNGERHPIDLPPICRGRRPVWEDAAGRLWFGYMAKARRGWQIFEPGKPLTTLPAHVMCASRDGGVWVDHQTRSISKYRGGSLETYEMPEDAPPRFVAGVEDPEGRLWLTSRLDGLWCIDEGRVRSVDRRHGLPDQRLGALLLDDQHRLWVNSAGGVFRVEREHVLAAMGGSEQRVPFRWASRAEKGMSRSVRGRNGKLYFLSAAGWFEVDPTRAVPTMVPRQARVVAVRSHGAPVDIGENRRLPLGVRSLEIEYTAVAPASAEDLEFSHRLQPVENEWDETGRRRIVEHASLGPGVYRFQVRARHPGQDWGVPSRELRFEVVPYFYETVWFKSLLFGLVLMVGYVGYCIRTASLRRHNAELGSEIDLRVAAEARARAQRSRARNAQEEERRRVAHELHDGIGQRMALLVMRLEAAGEPGEPGEPGGSTKLSDEAREIGRNIQRLSRALHPAWIGAVGIVSALRGLVERSAERADPNIDFRGEGDIALPEGAAVDLYRIAQEALQNAIRHGGAQSIELTIEETVGAVVMTIRDDGSGFDSESSASGLGLVTMRERASGIGAALRIDSTPGAGTLIHVTLPIRDQA